MKEHGHIVLTHVSKVSKVSKVLTLATWTQCLYSGGKVLGHLSSHSLHRHLTLSYTSDLTFDVYLRLDLVEDYDYEVCFFKFCCTPKTKLVYIQILAALATGTRMCHDITAQVGRQLAHMCTGQEVLTSPILLRARRFTWLVRRGHTKVIGPDALQTSSHGTFPPAITSGTLIVCGLRADHGQRVNFEVVLNKRACPPP